MAGKWKEVALSELADIYDGPHATPTKAKSGPVFLGISNLARGRLDLSDSEHVSEADYVRWTRRVTPNSGDVVFSYETRLGEAALIPAGLRCCLGRRMGLLRAKPGKVDARFLLYAYLGPQFQKILRARATPGSTVDRIPLIEMPGFPIKVPESLTEQRAIAHILGTLDDKIELNRRMSETLDEMARALFQSWFVDFDPVRAKAEGRDTGLPKHLADLFPDSFEDSELGEIPLGWGMSPLSDCVEVDRGLSYKGAGLSEAGMPMHNLNSISEGGGYKHEGIKHYQGEHKSHHIARAGDLIVANTEQGHKRLLIGYAAIIPERFGDATLFSHHIYRVRPKHTPVFTPDWLCHLLNSRIMHDTVSGYANGTTVNMLPVDGLQSPLVVVPPPPLIRAFDGLAVAARKRHEEMTDENRTLANLRDVLLPKLISGELRIEDAQRLLSGAE